MSSLPVRVAAAAIVALLGVSSCGGNDSASNEPTPSPTAPEPIDLPDTPVGEQVAWLLEQLAAEQGPPAAEVEQRFADAFLAEVAPDQFADEVLGQLRLLGPWTATGLTGGTHTAEVALRTGDGEPWALTIALDRDERIESLFFEPDPTAGRSPVQSFEELTNELADLADHAGFLAARLEGDTCTPVAELAPAASLPMGSIFKLYVLGAVADAVAEGTVSWDDQVTVTDEQRSLPSGELQDAPAGTEVTVRDAAQGMIAISDNTAADLLVNLFGRQRVEATVAAFEHAEPDRNVPFLTTREFFLIGWSDPPERREQWATGDRAARTGLLDELAAAPLEVEPADPSDPVWPDEVGWFGSPDDLCAAHRALQDRAGTEAGAPLREILSANPGIEIDSDTWPYVAFKGGSAPGVLAGSWYAEHTDGSAVVVAFQLASRAPLAKRLPFAVVADAFPLLADELG